MTTAHTPPLPQPLHHPPQPDAIQLIPPPWHVTGDVYCLSFWTSTAAARKLPAAHAFSPLEAADASFACPVGSKPAGGLGMIQIIRYHDSPVGPYDEMLVVPGSFDWVRRRADGREEVGRNPRISRIYVSQRQTCHNGRINWGCPKHLARFDWTTTPDSTTTVKIYPHDTTGDASESSPSSTPFFQASFKPVTYAPPFPFATRWLGLLGFNTTLVMPPLPRGHGSQGELPGTDRWCSFLPNQYSRSTRVGWFDLAQGDHAPYDNFWPGLGRWQLGFKMENANVVFDKPLDAWSNWPKAKL
ncbi:acetoacetate decarboxylase (ADC) domain-containing protein [Ophiocordyceps camponoti-floridani]|uniref:Acetoacetate decarboxylase (ADC) domain-containing protein n=1 Tax=Ophiocordyceps camponoti-floridani TaxID=2030778 RepID=A0A8H4VBZ8_9HYPO|nr:acetoacetate decarboxylase (ADC) domain-containing protein [Ophiocordyceps camponoti-floridani]